MDLFTKRCGCGVIFKPAVATSRSCTKCESTALSRARAQLPAGGYREPVISRGFNPATGEMETDEEYRRKLLGSLKGEEHPKAHKNMRCFAKPVQLPASNVIPSPLGSPTGLTPRGNPLSYRELSRHAAGIPWRRGDDEVDALRYAYTAPKRFNIKATHEGIVLQVKREFEGRQATPHMLDAIVGRVHALWNGYALDQEVDKVVVHAAKPRYQPYYRGHRVFRKELHTIRVEVYGNNDEYEDLEVWFQ